MGRRYTRKLRPPSLTPWRSSHVGPCPDLGRRAASSARADSHQREMRCEQRAARSTLTSSEERGASSGQREARKMLAARSRSQQARSEQRESNSEQWAASIEQRTSEQEAKSKRWTNQTHMSDVTCDDRLQLELSLRGWQAHRHR